MKESPNITPWEEQRWLSSEISSLCIVWVCVTHFAVHSCVFCFWRHVRDIKLLCDYLCASGFCVDVCMPVSFLAVRIILMLIPQEVVWNHNYRRTESKSLSGNVIYTQASGRFPLKCENTITNCQQTQWIMSPPAKACADSLRGINEEGEPRPQGLGLGAVA